MPVQEELDGLATNYPDRFKIYYVLNQVSCYAFRTIICLLICYVFFVC